VKYGKKKRFQILVPILNKLFEKVPDVVYTTWKSESETTSDWNW